MLRSMTGFMGQRGQGRGYSWVWSLRAVNGKSFDLRLRLPEVPEGLGTLETMLRPALTTAIARGNVTLTLRLWRDKTGDLALPKPPKLAAALAALAAVEKAAEAAGLVLANASAAEVLNLRAFAASEDEALEEDEAAELQGAILADVPGLIESFNKMRALEGAMLQNALEAQLGQIENLVEAARAAAQARGPAARRSLEDGLARLLGAGAPVDENRMMQELAALALRQDVEEELTRLSAHTAAARALLAEEGPVGRKLDFLAQEFMREANTLCSKAQDITLTRLGLDLKAVIDQMREQVQNVE